MSAKEWRDFTEDHVWKLKENTNILNKTYLLSISLLVLCQEMVVNTKTNKAQFLIIYSYNLWKVSNFQ